ncbi:unnamed protein product [Moneuplotes crassus]|uniref:Exonuclease 1 n=1 Tax=Euplotes crassus TaxID=5936 RepID=A0AAD1X5V8_EUPCR|nr:unnamed protein product [Moneuplotes crassus]
MGISGLLHFLRQIKGQGIVTSISKYSGMTVAVDASCWIHQGAYSCDFSEGIENCAKKIINFVLKKLRMLLEHKIKPIIVFDGAPIPMKNRIQEARAKLRLKSREKVARMLREGNNDATKKYGEGFTMTPYLVNKLYKIIKSQGCTCIVAPYEADAQLSYLFKKGKVDMVFTEDSDLIAYGVTKLFYRYDNEGKGYEIDMEGLFYEDQLSDKIRGELPHQIYNIDDYLEPNSFENHSEEDASICSIGSHKASQASSDRDHVEKVPIFSKEKFLLICVLAGCDYIEPIKGVGFKTAYKLLTQNPTVKKAIMSIIAQKKYTVPQGYLENFKLAIMTFLFQVVYDPEREECINLTNPEENKEYGDLFLNYKNQDFLGRKIPKEYAKDICTCQIDIRTKKPFDMNSLFLEYCELNNPLFLTNSSEDEEKSNGLKEISDPLNILIHKKKKPATVQKKFSFTLGKKVRPRRKRRIPSPFRDKLVEDVVNLDHLNEARRDKNSKMKRFKQLILTENDNAIGNSDSEEDVPSNSLMAMFKRAKRSEEDTGHKDVMIPKFQTIKKKTFMSSIKTSPDLKEAEGVPKPAKGTASCQDFMLY